MLKEELEKELTALRDKWKGRVPRFGEKEYWDFRCDRFSALGLKRKLEDLDKRRLVGEMPDLEVEKLFS